MKVLASLLLMLVWAAALPASSEPIRVRSGEHGDFTRLVVDFTASEGWSFGRAEGGYELRPERTDISYRLDRAFDKIGRRRVSDLRDLGNGRLQVTIPCACHAEVQELASGKVVIDIYTGEAAEPGTGFEADLPGVEAITDTATPQIPAQGELPEQAEESVADPAPAEPVAAQPAPEPARQTADQPVAAPPLVRATPPYQVGDRAGLPLMWSRPVPLGPVLAPDPAPPSSTAEREIPEPAPQTDQDQTASEQPSAPTGVVPPDPAARIAQTEAALLQQVARAAAQGLLEADIAEIEDSLPHAEPDPVFPEPAAPPMPPVAQRGHVTVETSVDRALAHRTGEQDETAEGAACLDPALFAVETWGNPVANGTDIGAYRTGIVGEFDLADRESMTALARNYIYITFGAEAIALIQRYADSIERPDLLFAMAEIMDNQVSQAAPDLVGQMSCDGATALWATLAQPEIPPGQPVNTAELSLAFNALPTHLRRHLGPELATRLLAAGETDTANRVLAATERAGTPTTSSYDLVAAEIDRDAGRVSEATAAFDDIVAAADGVLPEAVLERVMTTLDHGGAVPDDIVVLLDSLAFQVRGTDLAYDLTDAAIRSRASAGAFAAAFEQLKLATEAPAFPRPKVRALRNDLYDRMARDTDAATFLRLALPRLSEGATVSAPVRRLLAERFLDLHLPDPARRLLERDDAAPETDDRRLLARVALLERRPAVAIGYLAGLADAPAQSLRAAALELAQDHLGAMRAFEETGQPERALQAAWQGGLWPDVAARDDGPRGAAALMMAGTSTAALGPDRHPDAGEAGADASVGPAAASEIAQDDAGSDAVLAEMQALVTKSATTRGQLEALLATVSAPSDHVVAPAETGS